MDRILFVAAVSEEAAHLPEGADLLVTGIGTLPAAITLTEELCTRRAEGRLPERIVNIGTCGALRDEIPNGVYEIDRVHKHDFQVVMESDIAFDALPREITPETSWVRVLLSISVMASTSLVYRLMRSPVVVLSK